MKRDRIIKREAAILVSEAADGKIVVKINRGSFSWIECIGLLSLAQETMRKNACPEKPKFTNKKAKK